jgi:hypothetical protein
VLQRKIVKLQRREQGRVKRGEELLPFNGSSLLLLFLRLISASQPVIRSVPPAHPPHDILLIYLHWIQDQQNTTGQV